MLINDNDLPHHMSNKPQLCQHATKHHTHYANRLTEPKARLFIYKQSFMTTAFWNSLPKRLISILELLKFKVYYKGHSLVQPDKVSSKVRNHGCRKLNAINTKLQLHWCELILFSQVSYSQYPPKESNGHFFRYFATCESKGNVVRSEDAQRKR